MGVERRTVRPMRYRRRSPPPHRARPLPRKPSGGESRPRRRVGIAEETGGWLGGPSKQISYFPTSPWPPPTRRPPSPLPNLTAHFPLVSTLFPTPVSYQSLLFISSKPFRPPAFSSSSSSASFSSSSLASPLPAPQSPPPTVLSRSRRRSQPPLPPCFDDHPGAHDGDGRRSGDAIGDAEDAISDDPRGEVWQTVKHRTLGGAVAEEQKGGGGSAADRSLGECQGGKLTVHGSSGGSFEIY